jgi:hypothetical protein
VHIGADVPEDRVPRLGVMQELQKRIRKLTNSPEPLIANGLLGMMGYIPKAACEGFFKATANKVSISMSNVPGPQFDTAWCGGPVSHCMFFVPPTGSLSTFVTIITFNGKVVIGMSADDMCMTKADLQSITSTYMQQEVDMLEATSM